MLPATLTSCFWHHHATEKTAPLPSGVPQTQNPPSFTRVNVSGSLNVNLHTGAKQPQLIFHGDPRDLSGISWQVQHHELFVNLGRGYPKYGPVTVDVYSHYLVSFTFKGKGTISGKQLYSRSLDLYIKNKGKTQLDGQIALNHATFISSGYTQIQGIHSHNLQLNLAGTTHVQLSGITDLTTLTMKGQSWLSLYWVKSHKLKAQLKENARAQLAGVVAVLDLKVCDSARFNGRYLRANEAFVKTFNQAEADISVLYAQHTIAHDASNIYYYKLPDMKTDFMVENGSVLDMREWERTFMQDTTRYNQQL